MKVLFCGSEIKGNFIGEISRRRKDEIIYAGAKNHINNYEQIIFENQYDVIIIDVSELLDEVIIIADYIERLKKAKNSKIIVFAANYTYKTKMIDALIKSGIVNFILSNSLASQNDDYEKCLSGYFDKNGLSVEIHEEEKRKETEREHKMSYSAIGIAGVINRIGTTTQAMQLVKYLMLQGYKACYIEVNTSNFIDKCTNLFNIEKKSDGYVNYCDIDMYKSGQINSIIQSKYDYLVYDYGSIDEPSFNKLSFNEKDITIFVTGSMPDELEKISPVLESNFYRDSFLIFNFVPEGDKKEILESMCDRAAQTCFTAYVPDPFDYVNCEDGITTLIDVPCLQEAPQKKKSMLSRFTKRKANI